MKKLSALAMLVVAPLFTQTILAQDEEPSLPVLIIVDFDGESASYSHSHYRRFFSKSDLNLPGKISEMIQDNVISSGLFDVMEREKLDTIMQEHGLQGSGMVDTDTISGMGKMVGAGYILTGKIISMDAEEKTANVYGVRTRTTTLTLRAKAEIVETATGRIVFSKSAKASSVNREGGGLESSNSGAFVDLAEELANEISTAITRSDKFKVQKKTLEMVVANVTSVPEMADVEVDGVFFGNAGGEMELPAGMHSVRISIPGYTAWDKKVMIKEGTRILARLRPEQPESTTDVE
jgi:curli biogenesis system outer membrane secretion channel CsgG